MGEKNSFRFDPVTATWKSDDDDDGIGESENGLNVYEGGQGLGLRLENERGRLINNNDEEEEEYNSGLRGKGRERGSYDEICEDNRERRDGRWSLRDGSTIIPQGQGLDGGASADYNDDPRPRVSMENTQYHHDHDHDNPPHNHGTNAVSGDDGDGSALDGISSSPISTSHHPTDFQQRTSPSALSSASAIKMSPHVFLLVITMYFLSCLVESGMYYV